MSAHGFGVVALAAFRPDPVLFERQLTSIQEQTHRDFLCLISADGSPNEIVRLVDLITECDPRFRVIGHDERLGFYLNFERVLAAVPDGARWVALSDQDDVWYPHKLETLLPHLEHRALVTGQARIVGDLDGTVLLSTTARRTVPFADLLLHNQVTGAFSVFRSDLLELALPFPRLNTVTQLHDHWLAVCAAASGGYSTIDDVLQDYVQHGNNLVGEPALIKGSRKRWVDRVKLVMKLHSEYGEDPGIMGVAQTCNRLSFGWRRAMVETLVKRLNTPSPEVAEALECFGANHSLTSTGRYFLARFLGRNVDAGVLATFLAGLPSEFFRSRREPRRRRPLDAAVNEGE